MACIGKQNPSSTSIDSKINRFLDSEKDSFLFFPRHVTPPLPGKERVREASGVCLLLRSVGHVPDPSEILEISYTVKDTKYSESRN